MSETTELMQLCAEAARLGGTVLRDAFGRRRTIEYKGSGRIDLVTDADRASEAALLEFLGARCPGAAILSEESGASGEADGRLRFIVDPLDGTTNYAHGIPQFAVNVAVEDRQGLKAGATYDPLRGELYLGGLGEGATLNGEPIEISRCADLVKAVLATGFPYDVQEKPEPPMRLFGAFIRRARAIRRMGSAALDLAYVACGRFDGFWEVHLKPWDVGAGILLVREAGGRVANFDGDEGAVLTGGAICAAGPALQRLLLEVLAGVRGARQAP
ncbi:MAG TPA: inositol monophosphatase family protein [Anaeromyxobacteraceae bacterium]|nr:inositol monophosphatase family protein [Anaeromyxobacteraceae bacterium]